MYILLLKFLILHMSSVGEGNGTPLQYSCLENPMDGGDWKAAVHGVAEGQTWLSGFTFTFHFHALEKEMATHSNVLAWRIPGTGKPGGLPSMGSHRVGHDWSDLAIKPTDKINMLSKDFSASNDHMFFIFQFVDMVYHVNWFAYTEESLHPWDKPNLIIVYELFILFARIWLRIFASMFISDIDL